MLALAAFAWSNSIQASGVTLTEGAENGTGNVVMGAPSGYEMISSRVFADGARHSFHLTHPDGSSQWVQLKDAVRASLGARLQFQSMLRYATDTQVARVQVSPDGQQWQELY